MTHSLCADPLMKCLVTLTRLNNKPVSEEAVCYGLPFDPSDETPRLFSVDKPKSNFSRAADKAGFTSRLLKRNLNDIPSVVLPVILTLKGDNACVLTDLSQEEGLARIILPAVDETPMEIDLAKLQEEYLGYVFFLQRKYEGFGQDKGDAKAARKEHWFFGTLKRFRKIYGNAFLATLLINLFVVVGPLFTMNVYDRIIPHNAVDTLWVLVVGVCLIYVFDLILKYLRATFLESAAKKSDIILSSMVFEQALNLKMEDRPRSVGAFSSSIKEFDGIRSFFASGMLIAFIELPFAIIFLLVIYSINETMVMVPLTIILLILVISIPLKRSIHHIVESTYNAVGQRNGVLVESLSNLETIKAFNANSSMQWHWEESTGDIAAKSLRSRMRSSFLSNMTVFLTQFGTVAVVVLGVYLIMEGELSMGGLIAITMLSSRTIGPMAQAVSLLSNFEQMKASLNALNELMQKETERPANKQFLRRPNFKGEIEFRDVDFNYPDEDKKALEKVNLHVKPKESVGIIGAVGSGKSTIARLLLGFYLPASGGIYIDGLDIKQIDPADLRDAIGYVPQDVVLFSGTVRDNITLKSPHAADEDIIAAAAVGGVDTFTNRHPLGMDLQVGERGFNLSGGQRQSIGVARCFIEKPPMVLLDEPTNSMDFNTELQVIRKLKEVCQDRTTIVITHKPTILEIVDRIIVMDNGKIVMDGPKEKVLARLGGKKS
jgi:ATP-binding cassette subfamily C protein LapB